MISKEDLEMVNKAVIAAIEEEYLGKDDVDKYYEPRAKRKNVIADEVVDAANYIISNYPKFGVRYMEIGGGCGEFSLLMAATGRSIITVEANQRRFSIMTRAKELLGGEASKLITPVLGIYPTKVHPSAEIIVTNNIASSFWDTWDSKNKLESFFGTSVGILDSRLWWKIRGTEEERDNLIRDMRQEGFQVNKAVGTYIRVSKT